MTLGIEQCADYFVGIATKIDAIVEELRDKSENDSPKDDIAARLQPLSWRLRELGEGMAARVVGTAAEQRWEAPSVSGNAFRSIVESLPDNIARWDCSGNYLYANPTHARTVGRPAAELVGMRIPDSYVQVNEALARVLATEAPLQGVRQELSDEREGPRVHEISFVPERDALGRIVSILGIGRDISERVRAQEELQSAHMQLVSVLQTIPDLVWLKNNDGIYLRCNHAFERLTGMREHELVGKTDYELFDADVADFFRLKDNAAIEARQICINEEWVSYPDTGRKALLETRKMAIFDASDNAIGVLGVARDITERRRFEEMLSNREREFRTLVEHSPDIVIRYGSDYRRRYVNPAFTALLGEQEETLIGNSPSSHMAPSNLTVYEKKLHEVFASGKGLEFEFQWEANDGRRPYYLMRFTPELGVDGTVQTVLASGRDITDLHAYRNKIHRMAFYDALTGLPNRALFEDQLQQAITGLASRTISCVMMVGVDRFKGVNDTMGYSAGDDLLREAAQRLRAGVRAGDSVARFGGDEFAVLLPSASDVCTVESVASAIMGEFDRDFTLNGKDIFVSCSIGIALYPMHAIEPDDLVKYANSALYLAKRSGRRGFRFYSSQVTRDAAKRLELDSALRHAAERRELELHYQPKVSFPHKEVIGSEALLRWRRPGIGLVSPNDFIPVAEETGLIAELGKWVLTEASRSAVEWNTEGAACHKVAINLSAKQFQSRDLAQMVDEILEQTGCRPEWLELEITESLLLQEHDKVRRTLSTFKSKGFSIAIDDFGTGYSSLSYLARFPIDTLKIDRSFVQKVTTDRRHAELVKAIVSIGRCLGLQVVAEGVETLQQAAFLAANGCDSAQGFLYSKPRSKSDMVSLPRYLAAAHP